MAAGRYPLWLELVMPPWRRYQISSHGTPEQTIVAVGAATEERRRFRMPFSATCDFEGVVDYDRFAINRIIGYRNSLRPLILGRVEAAPGGSRVTIVMRPDWIALASVIVIMAVAMTIVVLTKIGVGTVSGHTAGLGLIAAVTAGSYLMISVPFGLEARWANQMLREILRAEEIAQASEPVGVAGAYRPPIYARAPYTEAQFRRQTRIRRAFIAYFILVWIVGMAAFASFSIVYSSGTRSPRGAQTVAMTNHGRTVYVTGNQKFVADTLRTLMIGGIISIMLGALVIDRILGVPLFSNPRRHSSV